MQASDWGWNSFRSLSCLLMGLLLLVGLIVREKKSESPFLDLPLFKRPRFAAVIVSVSMAQFFIMIGVFWTVYFETILAYTPFEVGLISFVSGSPMLFAAPLAGFLQDRFGPKFPVAVGHLALIYVCFFFAFVNTPALSSLLSTLFCFGIGIPFILTPSFATAVSSVPSNKVGVAMGTLITSRMVGGAIGLACIHLLSSYIYALRLPEVGEREAMKASFSAVHFGLGFLILSTFAITFLLHSRKNVSLNSQSPP
jgi:MFS family permease